MKKATVVLTDFKRSLKIDEVIISVVNCGAKAAGKLLAAEAAGFLQNLIQIFVSPLPDVIDTRSKDHSASNHDVLITMGSIIFHVESSMAPDDVTSKSDFVRYLSAREQGKRRERRDWKEVEVERLGKIKGWEEASGKMVKFTYKPKNKVDRRDQHEILPGYRTKSDFDVTSSGAIEGSTTLKNPNSQSFREFIFLGCAGLCSTLSHTASYEALCLRIE
ncbi:hypothetical protein PRIPAC_88594 [Pristionchus pacificus]|uniref:Uncharacterized protein n=1 Tax=Pristionchus pacificus TaxID=54126 RepID=A0A2A6CX50_PRIPA|nr:hypothetical protein PRIPAC_88594 [Pristionchus pacificus]|eukprot:PDM82755.1 hypothetical protein PRIPAC_37148 [Pristionchus pacificus]